MLVEEKTIGERKGRASKVLAATAGRTQGKHRTSHGVWQLLLATVTTLLRRKGAAQIPNLHHSGVSTSPAGALCGEAVSGYSSWDKAGTGAWNTTMQQRAGEPAPGTHNISET